MDSLLIKVPCGFGPPGSLPQPFPSGVDGGIIVIPEPPQRNPTPIAVPFPFDNPPPPPPTPIPVPIPPGLNPVPPTIGPTNVIPGITNVLISYTTNVPTTASCTFYVTNVPTNVFADSVLSLSHNIQQGGLAANTYYTFTLVATDANNQTVSYNGSFTTLLQPIQTPTIVNEAATFFTDSTGLKLSVTWDTIYGAQLVNTNAILTVRDINNNIVFLQDNQVQESSHFFIVPGLLLNTYYSLTLESTILGQGSDINSLALTSPSAVGITNILVTKDTSSIRVDWSTSINSNTSASIFNGASLVNTFSNPTPVQNHSVIFTDLISNTLYLVIIRSATAFSSDTRTIAITTDIFQAQLPIPIPVGVIIDQPPPNPTGIPGDPPVPLPTEIVNESFIYTGFLNQSINSVSEVDLRFTPYTIKPTEFLPVIGEKNTELLNPIRHASINRILNNKTVSFEEANLDNQNINSDHIKNSLKPTIRDILYNLAHNNGVPIQSNFISDSLKKHIVDNSLSQVEHEYILSLTEYTNKKNDKSITKSSIQKSTYGNNRDRVKQSRQIINKSKPSEVILSPNRKTGVDLIKKNLLSIDPEKYSDDSKELLQLWYTLPTDVFKRLEILKTDGTTYNAYIENTDSFQFQTSSGSSVTIPAEINDSINVLTSNGEILQANLTSDVGRAFTLRNQDEHLIMFHLGIEKDILLEVSCATSAIEFNAAISSLPPTHFVLKLNTSEISDSNLEEEIFIRQTEAYYDLMTTSIGDVSAINDDIEFRAYPWLILPISYNDPILDYFDYINLSATNNSFKLTFKDLSYNFIGSPEKTSDFIIVRKIPRFIIVLPTDKTKYNFYNSKSVLEDLDQRKLRFVQPFDKNLNSPGLLTHPLTVNNTFINSDGESKSGEFSTQAYKCTYLTDQITTEKTYRDPINLPEKTVDGFRKSIQVILDLSANYNLDNGLTWFDVLSRLDRPELYQMLNNKVKVINKIKNGERTNTKLFHIKNPKQLDPAVKASNTKIISKIDEIQIPANPPLYPVPIPPGLLSI